MNTRTLRYKVLNDHIVIVSFATVVKLLLMRSKKRENVLYQLSGMVGNPAPLAHVSLYPLDKLVIFKTKEQKNG